MDEAQRRYAEIRSQVATLSRDDRTRLNEHFQVQRNGKQAELKELATAILALRQLQQAAPGLFDATPEIVQAQRYLEGALPKIARVYTESVDVAADVARATVELEHREPPLES
jgi:hypothetical protein